MKKKLLLADDSITIQKVVGIIFATEDCELLTASDGDKAYEMALTHKPDLVIADISMPGKNGFDLCREIKSNPALAATSVLLLPGAFEEFDETRAIDVCADGWLTKPFESQALLEKVAALFEMPPLRLVEAEETAPDLDVSDSAEDSSFLIDDTGALFDDQDTDSDQADQLESEKDTAADDESDLWKAVSFEEEDFAPQDLLAAGEIDDDEDLSDFSTTDESTSETSEVLTPEQLAPYVRTPVQPVEKTLSPESQWDAAPDQDDDAEESFVTDEVVFEPITEKEPSSGYADVIETDEFVAEPSPLPTEESSDFEFLGAQDGTSEEYGDDFDEVVELMETELDQNEELVEDSDTFIDLSAADSEPTFASVAENTPLSSFGEFEEEGGGAAEGADEEIIDLSEHEIIAQEGSFVTAEPADEFVDDLTAADEAGGFAVAVADEEEAEATVPSDEEGTYIFNDSEPEAVVTVKSAEEEKFLLFEDADEADSGLSAAPDLIFEEEAELNEDLAEETFRTDGATPVGAPAAAVEEQLRQLSEEELKQVVATVAGPLIEAMAREMLQQIVWEVVPDLAETMISEEIEKIKQGM